MLQKDTYSLFCCLQKRSVYYSRTLFSECLCNVSFIKLEKKDSVIRKNMGIN